MLFAALLVMCRMLLTLMRCVLGTSYGGEGRRRRGRRSSHYFAGYTPLSPWAGPMCVNLGYDALPAIEAYVFNGNNILRPYTMAYSEE